MASTFIKRIVAPDELTDAEKAAIEVGAPTINYVEEGHGLPVHPVCDVGFQIIKGRISPLALLQWLTPAEKVDADHVLVRVQDSQDPLNMEDVERTLRVGERKLFTHQDIETIFGIT